MVAGGRVEDSAGHVLGLSFNLNVGQQTEPKAFFLSVSVSVIHTVSHNTTDVPSCHSLPNHFHNYRLSQCAAGI